MTKDDKDEKPGIDTVSKSTAVRLVRLEIMRFFLCTQLSFFALISLISSEKQIYRSSKTLILLKFLAFREAGEKEYNCYDYNPEIFTIEKQRALFLKDGIKNRVIVNRES